jgi:hypothetical protein
MISAVAASLLPSAMLLKRKRQGNSVDRFWSRKHPRVLAYILRHNAEVTCLIVACTTHRQQTRSAMFRLATSTQTRNLREGEICNWGFVVYLNPISYIQNVIMEQQTVYQVSKVLNTYFSFVTFFQNKIKMWKSDERVHFTIGLIIRAMNVSTRNW